MKNSIALGTFDGLHKGHMAVLTVPDEYNKIALTFEKPPMAVMTGEPELLMSFSEKEKRLAELGITAVKLKFEDIRDIEAEDFLLFIKEKFSPAFISCGFNYRFGKEGKGDTALLSTFCAQNNIELKIAEPVIFDGEVVSSTRIRGLLKECKIEEANRLLTRPFSFEAEVISGDKRGRNLGFPTINQIYPPELVSLKFGVYKTRVLIDDKEFTGLSNIGKRPTYPINYVISETYIKGFSGNLYGKTVKILPVCFLRPERKFSSLKELKEQISKDLESI
ncbi:MAG: riboflavin biosynthesis protein RibF [Acutalibacteraceae bacterium]|jgi:riboflavin kinase/FMN adenylyltransferase